MTRKVRFSCPRCLTVLQTDEQRVGCQIACPHCSFQFQLNPTAGKPADQQGESETTKPAGISPNTSSVPDSTQEFDRPHPSSDSTDRSTRSTFGKGSTNSHDYGENVGSTSSAAYPSSPTIPGAAAPPPMMGDVQGNVNPASYPGYQPHNPMICPNCRSQAPALIKSEVTILGWIIFFVLLFSTIVFCWIGLLIRKHYRICSYCKVRLGQY